MGPTSLVTGDYTTSHSRKRVDKAVGCRHKMTSEAVTADLIQMPRDLALGLT